MTLIDLQCFPLPTNQPKNAAQFITTTSSTGGGWIDCHATAYVFGSNNTERRREAVSKLALSDLASILGFQIVAHMSPMGHCRGGKKQTQQHKLNFKVTLTVAVVAP